MRGQDKTRLHVRTIRPLVARRGQLIRIAYALCLAGATINHVRAVQGRGCLPADLPLPTAVYWSSLTFLDPLAAVLLFLRPRLGIAMAVAIILSDVAHNLLFRAHYPISGSLFRDTMSSPFMVGQIVFLLFVAATCATAWNDAAPAGGA